MLRFGRYELDEGRRLLHRAGARVSLQPRVFDLLIYLIRNRERAVSRTEILQTVWAGVVVERSVLSTTLQKLRKGLEDETGSCPWIETVHGFGLRFQGEVETTSPAATTTATSALPTLAPLATAGEARASSPPAITVLAPSRVAETSRDLTLLTCEALAVQLHQCQALPTLDADLVTDRTGRLLRSARRSKIDYVLRVHATRGQDGVEALARLTDVATLRVVWSQRALAEEADPVVAVRRIATQIAASVSTHLLCERIAHEAPETGIAARTH
jgi:DNA-binding winged helix-turn-helix (wHTH) protein